jgi:hypothetical protein
LLGFRGGVIFIFFTTPAITACSSTKFSTAAALCSFVWPVSCTIFLKFSTNVYCPVYSRHACADSI